MNSFASELSSADIGRDLTISVSGILTGGTIEQVSQRFGMVSVTLDGTTFVLDEDASVAIATRNFRMELLTEPDLTERHRIMDRVPQRI